MRRHRGLPAGILALAMLVIAPAVRADGPARLLKDINQTPSDDRSSYPNSFTRLGNLLLFRARTHAAGFELWRTDGTAAGTSLVKDIYPGPSYGLDWPFAPGPRPPFVELNGVLLFPASDGAHGIELWRTDGTAAGTVLLKDILPGPAGALVTRTSDGGRPVLWANAVSGGTMYFLADDGEHGFELWRTDGTPGGTLLLRDIQPGPRSAFGSSLEGATLGSSFYFPAQNDASGRELWKTDGTSAGTVLVVEIRDGEGSGHPFGLTVLGSSLIFAASSSDLGWKLWSSDGTQEGTVILGDLVHGDYPTAPRYLTRVGDLVYFDVFQRLYRTNGTPEGTILLHAFFDGSIEFHGGLNGHLLVRADDGVHGSEPWISDGTPEGTVLLRDIHPAATFARFVNLVQVNGEAYFVADDGVHGEEIWRSDGTPGGTLLVADLTPGSQGTSVGSAIPWRGGVLLRTSVGLLRIGAGGEVTSVAPAPGAGALTVLGDRAIFDASDAEHGRELWSSDGTPEGTGLLRDVEPLPRTNGAYPWFLGAATSPDGKERALYAAYAGTAPGLWLTDGTPRGTEQLEGVTVFEYGHGASLGGTLYFGADDGIHGWELWKSDGTPAGTAMVLDLLPGQWGGLLGHPVAYKNRVYFVAEDEAHGVELWSSDGTAGGTHLLRDIEPGPEWSNVGELIVAGDTLFFLNSDGHGRELWRTDGTEAGTHLVKDIVQGFSGDCCSGMTPFQGRLLFQAHDGVHGAEPWMSDGTEDGTFLLKDILPGSGSSYYPEAVVAGTSVYFETNDGLHGYELWKSDGTTDGTFMVADIRPGAGSSGPNFLGPMGDSVVFMIRVGDGAEWALWTSDGSEANTQPMNLVFPGAPQAAGAFDLGILFSEVDADHGLELWRTDGTTAGTALVQDVASGTAWSYPRNFVRLGTRILFLADDPVASNELFVGRAAVLLGRPDQAVRDLGAEVRGLALAKGLETNLLAKLDAAAKALAAGRPEQAAAAVESFARQVEAQPPTRIDPAAAADLVEFARDLVSLVAAC